MNSLPLFSIIINNYNYGRYLGCAIESCLAQDYPHVETIVVDDGSTDDSRAIIASFGDRVRAVLKENGGQGSAFNAGFAVSTGSHVLFLDSDDSLRPDAIRLFVAGFTDSSVAKVQSRMRLVDGQGEPLGLEEPRGHLPSGDWREATLTIGPACYQSTPTSASAWPRWFLAKVLPMPEAGYRVAADGFLKNIVPLFGKVVSVQEPVVNYRLHGHNTSYWGWGGDGGGRLARDAGHYHLGCKSIADFARQLGYACDAGALLRGNWKNLVRQHLVERAEGRPGILLAQVLRAVWSWRVRLWKRFGITAIVLLIYAVPLKVAQRILLQLFRTRRIGFPSLSEKVTTLLTRRPHPLRRQLARPG